MKMKPQCDWESGVGYHVVTSHLKYDALFACSIMEFTKTVYVYFHSCSIWYIFHFSLNCKGLMLKHTGAYYIIAL